MHIRILVADDHSTFRTGLRAVIESQIDLEFVGEVADGEQAVAEANRLIPDVALLDIRMPKIDGLSALVRIIANGHTRVLMLTTYDKDDYLLQALSTGASGFLLKTMPPEELIGAIRVAARGDAIIDPSMTRRLMARIDRTLSPNDIHPELAKLTAREFEILLLVSDALSNAEISATLGIGEETVKTHVSNILAKLALRDRIQAVVYAHRNGLVRDGQVGKFARRSPGVFHRKS